jgi:hypothetical protein
MKRFLFSILFVLTIVSACSKTGPSSFADEIIGQWEGIKGECYENGKLVETELMEESISLTFASNGNYFIEADGSIEDSGTFVVSDSYLTIVSTEYGGAHTTILKIQTLNRKELILIEPKGQKEYWTYFSRAR